MQSSEVTRELVGAGAESQEQDVGPRGHHLRERVANVDDLLHVPASQLHVCECVCVCERERERMCSTFKHVSLILVDSSKSVAHTSVSEQQESKDGNKDDDDF